MSEDSINSDQLMSEGTVKVLGDFSPIMERRKRNSPFLSGRRFSDVNRVVVSILTTNGQEIRAFVNLPTFILNRDISLENIMREDGPLNYSACMLEVDTKVLSGMTPILYQHVFGFSEGEALNPES